VRPSAGRGLGREGFCVVILPQTRLKFPYVLIVHMDFHSLGRLAAKEVVDKVMADVVWQISDIQFLMGLK
jgi:hypothetical protein